MNNGRTKMIPDITVSNRDRFIFSFNDNTYHATCGCCGAVAYLFCNDKCISELPISGKLTEESRELILLIARKFEEKLLKQAEKERIKFDIANPFVNNINNIIENVDLIAEK